MELNRWKDFACFLARESAEVIRPHFGRPGLAVEMKIDDTPVTIADRDAEQLMRDLIRRHFPDHGILGEEFGLENEAAALRWVIDPIDGTKSFVAGTPQFGTLIALVRDSEPILGVISSPATGDVLLGDNEQTVLNGKPVRVRDTRNLSDAILLTTNLRNPDLYQSEEGWKRLTQSVREVYTWGDCHGYHLVACGGADIMCDPILNPWDRCALVPVIRGAGGMISDWQGQDAMLGNSIVASAPGIHADVIRYLNPVDTAEETP